MGDFDDFDFDLQSLNAELENLSAEISGPVETKKPPPQQIPEDDDDPFADFVDYTKPSAVINQPKPQSQTTSKPGQNTKPVSGNNSIVKKNSNSQLNLKGSNTTNKPPSQPSSGATSQRSSKSGAQNEERYISAIRTLNEQRNEARLRIQELESELALRRDDKSDFYKRQLDEKDRELNRVKNETKLIEEEKEILQRAIEELKSMGFDNQTKDVLDDQSREIESLKRHIDVVNAEKKFLQDRCNKLQNDLETSGKGGGGDSTTQLKIHIRRLEADLENSSIKIRRLVGAIKADRALNEKAVAEVAAERDEQEMRAEKVEVKLIQLIELLRQERKRHQDEISRLDGGADEQALEAAREGLKQAEQQIRTANQNAQEAEDALQLKIQELQKMTMVAKKKAREAQNAQEDAKALEEKLDKLVEATKILKEENNKLKREGGERDRTMSVSSGGNLSEELDNANQRANKLEAALRKLRQMLNESKEESSEKEKALEERLQRAEQRAKAAEERAADAAAAITINAMPPPSPMVTGKAPPPPPPPPNLKLNYEIKIKRTGQSDHIIGEKSLGPSRPKNQFVDSIVDAIRKGVTLKKTGIIEYGADTPSWESSKADRTPEDFLAEAAREIAENREKGERKRIIKQAPEKKQGAELDSLLKELEDLEDLTM